MRTVYPMYGHPIFPALTTLLIFTFVIPSAMPHVPLTGGDTLQILDSEGAPGDTVSVPIRMVNTFPVAEARWMITYDPSIFRAFHVKPVFPLWGICIVGIDTLVGHVHWSGYARGYGVIQPGSQTILYLVLNVRINAQPDTQVAIDFQSSYLADSLTGGVVPVMVNGVFTVTSIGVQEQPVASICTEKLNITPNPTDFSACVEYYVPDETYVTLSIYDTSGRLVKMLVRQRNLPGKYRVVWDGRDNKGTNLPSGVYFCQMSTGYAKTTRKLTLIR